MHVNQQKHITLIYNFGLAILLHYYEVSLHTIWLLLIISRIWARLIRVEVEWRGIIIKFICVEGFNFS